MRKCILSICFGIIIASPIGILAASDLTPEQVEQQIQLSHMLGQINQAEQNHRIQKVRTLGVDGYYEWLSKQDTSSGSTASNSGTK